MKNTRGLIGLAIAIVCGLLAAKMVSGYLKSTKADRPAPAAPVQPAVTTPPPLLFTEAIPKGMRAVSIPVDEVTGVSRQVVRGDRVDVVAISAVPGRESGRISRVLLQAVEVLSAAQEANPAGTSNIMGASGQTKKWVVTLLLTPGDAAALTAADASNTLALMVRNPNDTETDEPPVAMLFTAAGGLCPYRKDAVDAKRSNVQGMIAPGMRAFTIEIKTTDGAAGSFSPGDRIDIIMTCPFGHFASGGHEVGSEGRITAMHMASRIFMQNIEVLAVMEQDRLVTQDASPMTAGDEVSPMMVTPDKETTRTIVLHVTPEDAELLAVATDATSKSVIRLIARNANDEAQTVTRGQLLAELLTEKREYTSIEVLRGNEQQIRKFFKYAKGGIATRSETDSLSQPVLSNYEEEK